MTSVWSAAAWKDSIRSTYARLNKARLGSPALRSQQNYFLADKSLGGWNNDIFAVAKIQAPGVSVHQQDVVFAFVNNNFRGNAARSATFNVSATNTNGSNWFGIQANKTYNVVDLASINPTNMLWGSNGITGSSLIANGIYVGFETNKSFSGGQAQFLRLIDMTAGMTATTSNDYIANLPRMSAPQIVPIGNRAVPVGQTLTIPVTVTTAAGDANVSLAAASNLGPSSWSLNNVAQFNFSPPVGSEGNTYTFRFTATGQDGSDEETFTVTVTSALTPYEQWAAGIFGTNNLGSSGASGADPDQDGIPNYAEFHLGTDPQNANSRLTTRMLGKSGTNGTVEVVPVVPVGSYSFRWSASLLGPWSEPQPLNVGPDANGAPRTFSLPAEDLQTFYRIIYQPPAQ